MRDLIVGLYEDWIHLDERIEALAGEIDQIGEKEANCQRLMSVPGIGPHTIAVFFRANGRHSLLLIA
jgi:transposase